MSDIPTPRQIFSRYVSGEISPEEIATLETALRDDPDLRQEFIDYLNIDSALGDLAALSDEELKEAEQIVASVSDDPSYVTKDTSQRQNLYRTVVGLSALAATFLVIALVWNSLSLNDGVVPVATLVSEVDSVLMLDGKPWSSSHLLTGDYVLERGLMHLRFGGGVMVYIEAPARWKAASKERLVLYDGRISASVPPEGVGFTVETPEAEIIDFGTEFSVDVNGGASEVHVFEGLVRVQPRLRGNEKPAEAIDLRTSQAVKIREVSPNPVPIELAKNRFIRTFEEAKRKYPRTIKQLSPVAYYRMAIRDQGLASIPPEYSGVVLTGKGVRPPHASGVFAGGSLRVLANSTGRGGRVDSPPPLETGQLTLATYLYLHAETPSAVAVSDLQSDEGNFTLGINENSFLKATIRDNQGRLVTVSGDAPLPIQSWHHVVVTVDGNALCLYVDSLLVASTPCNPLNPENTAPLWFGRGTSGDALWNGRIDEVVIFDNALSEDEITVLYQAGLEEINGSP
ncbi:LamG-like jellyroll fold domain-containing protein [Bremerella sp. P1]|uniref:LamG-like jellyroll fold domain-containing protein n=1 Tax=Bremerella sp. P1 TaxID=3026424 RepID=UPI0023686192|nr:LamG-like jellyroll fold domain-containing protein [Bremerella sp. P1]WDI41575.1 FecR domain-containing protein [Bremerella sp. P1]